VDAKIERLQFEMEFTQTAGVLLQQARRRRSGSPRANNF
jgi:hypothetical protein